MKLAYGSAESQAAIVRLGGAAPLVKLTSRGSEAQRQNAAETINSLAGKDDHKLAIVKAGGLPPLVTLATDGTPEQRRIAAVALGNLAQLSTPSDDNRMAAAEAGAIKPLVELGFMPYVLAMVVCIVGRGVVTRLSRLACLASCQPDCCSVRVDI